MSFFQVWYTGYINPSRAFDELKDKPAPLWGFYGELIRGLATSFLYYLPLHLLGDKPTWPSYLTFLPTDRYYAASVFIFPVFELGKWLLLSAVVHITLRLARRESDFDQILNLNGMIGLVIAAAIIPFDWIVIAMIGRDLIVLGLSHLLIDFVWGLALAAIGYKKLLGLPYWLGAGLFFLSVVLFLPLAMIFLR
jgi:hypothetical protein